MLDRILVFMWRLFLGMLFALAASGCAGFLETARTAANATGEAMIIASGGAPPWVEIALWVSGSILVAVTGKKGIEKAKNSPEGKLFGPTNKQKQKLICETVK